MITWFIIGIIFLVIELLEFGLISIWFAIGAFVTMFFYNFDLKIQILIFVVVSGLSLLLIRNIAVKYMKGNSRELDRITGQRVKIQKIIPRGEEIIYVVRLDGKYWECRSSDIFEIGDMAEVLKISGNKLILKRK